MFTQTRSALAPDSKQAHKQSNRQTGLDIVRVVATVAVVLLHSGGSSTAPFSPAAIALRSYASFPVPVFLALSFYLSARTIAKRGALRLDRKLSRLLIPYAFFTGFYLLFNALQGSGLSPSGYFRRLSELLGRDPVGVFFLGQATMPLYFLPLLAIGTVAMQGISRWLGKRTQRSRLMAIATLLSAIAYQLLSLSGNAFVLGNRNLAFQAWASIGASDSLLSQPLARVTLVYLAWLFWCLPYIFGAFYLADILRSSPSETSPQKTSSQKTFSHSKWPTALLLAGTALVIVQPVLSPIDILKDVLLALLLVACGRQISPLLAQKTSRLQQIFRTIIHTISQYAFCIYLIHPVVLYIVGKLLPSNIFISAAAVTVMRVLTFLILGFIGSLALTALLQKGLSKPILRKCLGL